MKSWSGEESGTLRHLLLFSNLFRRGLDPKWPSDKTNLAKMKMVPNFQRICNQGPARMASTCPLSQFCVSSALCHILRASACLCLILLLLLTTAHSYLLKGGGGAMLLKQCELSQSPRTDSRWPEAELSTLPHPSRIRGFPYQRPT